MRNLVYLIGLPYKFATEEYLRSHNFFGQYGKIRKIILNRDKSFGRGYQSHSCSAYITFESDIGATMAILGVDGGRWRKNYLKASFGMTKFCSYFLNKQVCPKEKCLFLHREAQKEDVVTAKDKATQRVHVRVTRRNVIDFCLSLGPKAILEYRDWLEGREDEFPEEYESHIQGIVPVEQVLELIQEEFQKKCGFELDQWKRKQLQKKTKKEKNKKKTKKRKKKPKRKSKKTIGKWYKSAILINRRCNDEQNSNSESKSIITGASSIRTESRRTSGHNGSDLTMSEELKSAKKSAKGPLLNELNKEIWSKKNTNEILTVSSRKAYKKPQSNRKQSTPVGGLEMASGMFSWKKNRKQSENIIFSSMDAWKTRLELAQNLDQSESAFVSKSSVFSSNLGMKPDIKPAENKKPDFDHSSTKFTECILKTPRLKNKPENRQESFPNILSNETDYTSQAFFQQDTQANMNSQSRTKSYLDLTQEESIGAEEETLATHKSLYQEDEPERKTETLSLSQQRNDPSGVESSSFTNSLHKTKNSSLDILAMAKFSLAQQNKTIKKKIALEQRNKTQMKCEGLLAELECTTSHYESPEANLRPTSSFEKKKDTPVLTSQRRSSRQSSDSFSEKLLQASHKKSKRPVELEAIDQGTPNLKQFPGDESGESEKKELDESGQTCLDENLKNLNSLIEQINRDPSRGQFSELDIKLMRTLSKSLKRSKLLIKTRSRYEFVTQEDTLRCSDIVVTPQDVPGSGDRGVLSIMNLIKAFLDPPHTNEGPGTHTPCQKNKVNISF